MSTAPDKHIFKIITSDIWLAAQQQGTKGVVGPMPIDAQDGYMHFSTAAQLRETLKLHFNNQENLMMLAVPVDSVDAHLKWEPSRGGQLFPHLYAELRLDQMEWAATVRVDDQGMAHGLPEGL